MSVSDLVPVLYSSRCRSAIGFGCQTTIALLALVMGCDTPTAAGSDAPFTLEVAYSFPSLASSDFITTFDFDDDGTLWVVSFAGAIIWVRNGQATQFEAASILGAAQVRDLFIDGAGRPWVTGGNSVAVFDGQVWSQQGPTNYMNLSPKAGQIAVNATGDVLLAAGDADAGGLLLRRGERWQAITPANSTLPSPLVREIEVARNGTFWVASAQHQGKGGLSLIEDDRIVAVFDKSNTGLLYNWIDDLGIATDRIWLAFAVPIYDVLGAPDGGIQELPLEGGRPTARYPFQTGLSSNRVQSLIWSAAGEVWFTTGLDEDSGCRTCVASVGTIDAAGRFHILSHFNSDLAPNEYLPQIREGPDGAIYVARAERNQLLKVVR